MSLREYVRPVNLRRWTSKGLNANKVVVNKLAMSLWKKNVT